MARVSQGAKIDAMGEKLDTVMERVDTILTALMGDIKTDKPGLFTRVDRLEQMWTAARWMLMLIIGALVPLAINSCQQRVITEEEHSGITEQIEELPEIYSKPVPTGQPTPTATPSPSYYEMREELTELRQRNKELEQEVQRLLELLEGRGYEPNSYLRPFNDDSYVSSYSPVPRNDIQGCIDSLLSPYITGPLWIRDTLWQRRSCVLGITLGS